MGFSRACPKFLLGRALDAQHSFADSGAPEVFQALVLRLETQLWMTSQRNFPRLQAILLGFAAPTAKPSSAVRTSRALCVRDVCHEDAFKATELVTGIQVRQAPARPPCGRRGESGRRVLLQLSCK